MTTSFKNISGTPLDIPLLGLHVGPDDTFDVPEEFVTAFALQSANYASDDPAVADLLAAQQAIPATSAAPVIAPSMPRTTDAPGDFGTPIVTDTDIDTDESGSGSSSSSTPAQVQAAPDSGTTVTPGADGVPVLNAAAAANAAPIAEVAADVSASLEQPAADKPADEATHENTEGASA